MSVVSREASDQTRSRLWMENGHGRLNLAPLMLRSAPTLTIFADNERQVPDGGQHLPFPEANEPNLIDNLNRAIDEHAIDIFWPQDTAKHELDGLHCDVHVPADPETIALIDDKVAFTEWLGDDTLRPDASEAIGSEEAAREYALRHALGRQVCIKPVIGVSSNGYWRLNELSGMSFLDTPEKRDIHPEVYFEALRRAEEQTGPQRLVVMEWLPGPEVSVDVLAWQGEPLIHAARTSLAGNRVLVESEHPVVDHARKMTKLLGLHGLINVQYRRDVNAEWKILEINPRPAGGCVKSDDAGFDVVGNWTRLITKQVHPEDVAQHHDSVLLRAYRASSKA